MSKLALLMLVLFPALYALGADNLRCEGQVAIEYKGIQRLSVWGRDNPFGSFVISNKSSSQVRLPLDNTLLPTIIHGQYIELQSRHISDVTWEMDAVVLEEFFPPQKWMTLGSGSGVAFFLDMIGPVSDPGRSESREYRVSLKDMAGCHYFSEPFRLAEVE
ncbi:hypothetical protein QFW77_00170 [Luteimonas sp. RD2P54]|uniref:Uncharacterized protein n=2 Tax=Luteimonas TaxID=83614 RepID=A0A853JAG1_9GAMM|nr:MULTISPECIES: hypothetical protein [Luteimonas]MDH5821410.1 hypothetical protein [Luteimonas endophytica]NZA25762.1 hypothetical protein [Luteimonas salinisoli]